VSDPLTTQTLAETMNLTHSVEGLDDDDNDGGAKRDGRHPNTRKR
jgi:hypothetical protein